MEEVLERNTRNFSGSAVVLQGNQKGGTENVTNC